MPMATFRSNMDHDTFIGKVQQRADLANRGEADTATRATLTTLGERIQAGEADDLASQLPVEIDRYLEEADSGQRFDFEEFATRVADRVELDSLADRPGQLAQAVMSVVADATGTGELQDIVTHLPQGEGYGRLLDFAEEEPEIDEEEVPERD
jgi:uncharacterized protein (DUF2267 family)